MPEEPLQARFGSKVLLRGNSSDQQVALYVYPIRDRISYINIRN